MASHDPSPQIPSGSDDQDDEWEYEYDEHETEDLYFTLDLTTFVPDALATIKQDENSQPATEGTQSVQQPELIPSACPRRDAQDPPEVPKTLQIIDLHTSNPMVKLDDEVYSCHWSTDLGSQIHIATAGTVENPRYAGNVLDVVGLSQARLLGKPVTLQKRSDVNRKPMSQSVPAEVAADVADIDCASSSDGDAEEESDNQPQPPHSNILPAPGEPLIIPRGLCKDNVAEEQADFLERFSAIKVKRGEFDPVPIYNVKHYNGPSAEERNRIRQRALEDDANATNEEPIAEPATPKSTVKRRRKRAAAEEDEGQNSNAKHGKRISGKSGRIPYEEIRAGLGYRSEYGERDETNDQ